MLYTLLTFCIAHVFASPDCDLEILSLIYDRSSPSAISHSSVYAFERAGDETCWSAAPGLASARLTASSVIDALDAHPWSANKRILVIQADPHTDFENDATTQGLCFAHRKQVKWQDLLEKFNADDIDKVLVVSQDAKHEMDGAIAVSADKRDLYLATLIGEATRDCRRRGLSSLLFNTPLHDYTIPAKLQAPRANGLELKKQRLRSMIDQLWNELEALEEARHHHHHPNEHFMTTEAYAPQGTSKAPRTTMPPLQLPMYSTTQQTTTTQYLVACGSTSASADTQTVSSTSADGQMCCVPCEHVSSTTFSTGGPVQPHWSTVEHDTDQTTQDPADHSQSSSSETGPLTSRRAASEGSTTTRPTDDLEQSSAATRHDAQSTRRPCRPRQSTSTPLPECEEEEETSSEEEVTTTTMLF